MFIKSIIHSLIVGAFFASGTIYAEEAKEFKPEVLKVEARIKTGPNVLIVDQSWSGASRVNVLSGDDLSHKGILSVGVVGQLALSKDSKTAYTVSVYSKRLMSGPTENVLEEFDVATLTKKREIVLSEKTIYGKTLSSMLALSANEDYAIVQNATPATSISIVDLKAGQAIAEVPTPGCWGIYPSLDNFSFSTICGDGTLAKVTFKPDGSFSALKKSKPFFDADKDPIQATANRAGKDLLFTGFASKIFRVNDSGEVPALKEVVEFGKEIEGNWAPGGFDISAYNAANQVLFVLMHPDAEDGSHKNAAEEVWALDMKSKQVLFRTAVDEVVSITVTNDKQPVLFGMTEEGTVTRYEVDPEAKFAARRTKKAEEVGDWTVMGLTGASL